MKMNWIENDEIEESRRIFEIPDYLNYAETLEINNTNASGILNSLTEIIIKNSQEISAKICEASNESDHSIEVDLQVVIEGKLRNLSSKFSDLSLIKIDQTIRPLIPLFEQK